MRPERHYSAEVALSAPPELVFEYLDDHRQWVPCPAPA
jgi:hypothetical protein